MDSKEFGEKLVEVIKGYVERSLAPLEARLAALEADQTARALALLNQTEPKK